MDKAVILSSRDTRGTDFVTTALVAIFFGRVVLLCLFWTTVFPPGDL
jgi:hypothetical protein